jgi:hypothetical protein
LLPAWLATPSFDRVASRIWPKYTPCGTIDTGVAAEDAAYD